MGLHEGSYIKCYVIKNVFVLIFLPMTIVMMGCKTHSLFVHLNKSRIQQMEDRSGEKFYFGKFQLPHFELFWFQENFSFVLI